MVTPCTKEGEKMNTPARLDPKPMVENRYEGWLLSHSHIILPVLYIILIILVGSLLAKILAPLCATEANIYYYHLWKWL